MTVIEEALAAKVTGTTAISALIGSRYYPIRLPERVTYPAVQYQRISGPRVRSHTGPSSLAHPRFQLTVWATSYASAKAVATQLRIALDGFKGTLSGIRVDEIRLESDRDDYDEGTNLYRIDLDFIIWHQE
jgi:hypothetical protein